jgi:hypothetical protein
VREGLPAGAENLPRAFGRLRVPSAWRRNDAPAALLAAKDQALAVRLGSVCSAHADGVVGAAQRQVCRSHALHLLGADLARIGRVLRGLRGGASWRSRSSSKATTECQVQGADGAGSGEHFEIAQQKNTK